MRPRLAALAATQSGLITRRQAIRAGYTERELRTSTAVHGPWVAVRRGVYADRSLWEGLDERDGRWRLRDRAAQLTMSSEHVLSHDSAARSLELPFLRPRVALVHVTRPGVGGSRTEHGVKHHLSRLVPPRQVAADRLPVTSLARTALDLAREHGFETGVTACDAALQRGATYADFASQLDTMTCWPNITRARAAVEHADAGAESVGESLARLLVEELGIGAAQTQFAVRTPRGTAWCDLRVGCHVFEFDGRIKYLRQQEGGIASRPVNEILWDEKRRQNDVCAAGLGMSRIIWDELWGEARKRTLARLRSEYDVTCARFGWRLPEHLAAFDREQAVRRTA